MQVTQEQAQQLFEAGGFFILPLDQQGTEFGIDGSLWAVKKDSFAGIKFLPPGLHLFVYSAPPDASLVSPTGKTSSVGAGALFGQGIVIRHGLFRYMKPKEVIVRNYDVAREELEGCQDTDGQQQALDEVPTASTSSNDAPGPSKRIKTAVDAPRSSFPSTISTSTTSNDQIDEIKISKDYLKTLDPKLAPYPFEKLSQWQKLTSQITQATLDIVLARDKNGDSRCDTLMASAADQDEGRASTSRASTSTRTQQWGKTRPPEEEAVVQMEGEASGSGNSGPRGDSEHDGREERAMCFACFDLKRSWKVGAIGEEITRDSRDKSWLLKNVIDTQLGGEPHQLLAQMQLAFLVFTQLQNFSALDSYRSSLALLCRSQSTFLPSSTGLSASTAINLYAQLLSTVILPHIEFLRPEFFEEDLPGLDGLLQDELANLRTSLRAAFRHHVPSTPYRSGRNTSPGTPAGDAAAGFSKLVAAWEEVRKAADAKFGWQLGKLDPDDMTMLRQRRGRIEYNLLAEPDDDEEYQEEGEDAPVVVDL